MGAPPPPPLSRARCALRSPQAGAVGADVPGLPALRTAVVGHGLETCDLGRLLQPWDTDYIPPPTTGLPPNKLRRQSEWRWDPDRQLYVDP
eukprot:3414705-Rhodomonas_salina.1